MSIVNFNSKNNVMYVFMKDIYTTCAQNVKSLQAKNMILVGFKTMKNSSSALYF